VLLQAIPTQNNAKIRLKFIKTSEKNDKNNIALRGKQGEVDT
jgi:hypothetical protein